MTASGCLTGGARTAVRRQQTLRASVDWSHALLTEPEGILFRRLAVFLGGFDLDAAQAVAGCGAVQRYQVLDLLTLLVDKSLVVADDSRGRTRYRLLETVRQYALEKLGESGEADAVRTRHRDHYTSMAALLDTPARAGHERRIERAETDIDNLRAAFAWSREHSDIALALQLASSLQPLWLTRGRIREGLAWFDAALADQNATPRRGGTRRARPRAGRQGRARRSGGLPPTAWIRPNKPWRSHAKSTTRPCWRGRSPPAACVAAFNAEVARPYFTEAIGLARAIGDGWRLSQILGWQAYAAIMGRVTRSRRARPPKKDATSPTRSVTGTSRVRAAGASVWRR